MIFLSASIAILICLPATTTSFYNTSPITFQRTIRTTTPLFSESDEDQPSASAAESTTKETPSSISELMSTSTDAEIISRTSSSSSSSSAEIVQAHYNPPQGEAWKHGFFPETPQLITLDATDTLIQLRSSVGMFYREVLFEATEYNARLPRPDVFSDSFSTAFKEMNEKYPCYGCGTGMSSKQWWYEVVKNTYDGVDIDEPGLKEEMDEWLLDEVFEALYADVFVTEEAWELRQGALEALSHLVQWRREGGPAIAIMSNFDERLHAILKNLDIYDAFDFVLTSREIGAAKPDRRMFEVAMSRLGLTEAGVCMHVGNRFDLDVVGASEAGWHAVYAPADGEQNVPKDTDEGLVFSAVEDLFGVLRMFGREPEERLIVTTRPIMEEGNYGFHQKTWTEDIPDAIAPQTPYALPSTEKKSWEGPGRF